MAIENIPINSGTGPKVAVDLVGTDAYQVMKLSTAADGSPGGLFDGTMVVSSMPAISGSVSVINTPTITVSTRLGTAAVTAANITVASITAGTLTAIGPFVVGGGVIASGTGTGPVCMGMQSGATLARPILVSTTGGLIIDSMPAVGGGKQYSVGDVIAATGTGTLIMGVQSGATTGRSLILSTTGGLIIDSMPAVGGGQQYPSGGAIASGTGSGTLMMGMQSGATLARSILVSTTGGLIVDAYTISNIGTVSTVLAMPVLSATGVTIASIAAGTVSISNTPVVTATVSVMPIVVVTASANPLVVSTVSTLLGTVGVNLAKILAQDIAVSGGPASIGTIRVELANDGTGAMRIVNTVSTVLTMPTVVVTASANPLIVSTVSTVLTMPVVTVTASANPLIVSTVSTVLTMPVLSATGVLLAATTAKVGAFVATAHSSRWNAYAVCTTSGAGLVSIVKVSGAHTLYVTDLLVSVDVPMMVTIYSSSATAMAQVYLATKGGFVFPMVTPMVLNSAQSLCIQGNLSGSVMGYSAGYTVT
jgi:hypothetical protein